MKKGWIASELPGFRKHHEEFSTYTLFSYENLPPIQDVFDDEFNWLRRESSKEGSLAEGGYSNGSKPDLSKLETITEQCEFLLPQPFVNFINSLELHKKVRSCTDCYIDVGDRAVKTTGSYDGYLVHFLSDSQWCNHWYLYISKSGEHFITTSQDAYGFNVDGDDDDYYATCRKDEIDLEHEEIYFCCTTFAEFIYRFWMENEIWFSLAYDNVPLTFSQLTYASHYLRLA